MTQSIDLPWSLFDRAFVSGIEGMRKPDLCFFQYVINEIGVHSSEMIMIDDKPENVCAARSQGMHALLVDKSLPCVGGMLRNLLQDPLQRADLFLKKNARNHHSIVEGHEEVILKDNFSQLIIWHLTDDEDIIYLQWPNGRVHGIYTSKNARLNDELNGSSINQSTNGFPNNHSNDQSNGHVIDNAMVKSDVKNGLWNYFFEAPVLTTRVYPFDAETTSIAYLSLPQRYLCTVADFHLVLEKMATNLDRDGIMQLYFDPTRPRTYPEACCIILRACHKFEFNSDPRIQKTEDYVVQCLNNDACLDGSRFYTTPESFLYFVAQLYVETRSESLRNRLSAIKAKLGERLNVPTNPMALALRLSACQTVGIDPRLFRKDLETFMLLQEEDGGWPAGHFCRFGKTGARIGNRGLTTALAVRILRQKQKECL